MDDLQICMKVQYDVQDGDLFLCAICESQNRRDASCEDQSFQSVFFFNRASKAEALSSTCPSHIHSMLEIKLNALLNVFFIFIDVIRLHNTSQFKVMYLKIYSCCPFKMFETKRFTDLS